jgi:hypothetical protein
MRRMRSFANSSKHPECTPANTVIGAPAAIGMTSGAAKFRLKSTSPLAIFSDALMPGPAATYRTSLKPSARSISSAAY